MSSAGLQRATSELIAELKPANQLCLIANCTNIRDAQEMTTHHWHLDRVTITHSGRKPNQKTAEFFRFLSKIGRTVEHPANDPVNIKWMIDERNEVAVLSPAATAQDVAEAFNAVARHIERM